VNVSVYLFHSVVKAIEFGLAEPSENPIVVAVSALKYPEIVYTTPTLPTG